MSRVANAGIAQVKAMLDLTEDDIERMFKINVFGAHNCYSSAAKQMISQGSTKPNKPGKIIGVCPPFSQLESPDLASFKSAASSRYWADKHASQAASIVGFKPFALLAHYSASKWAVRGLTQAAAMEFAEHNITVSLRPALPNL